MIILIQNILWYANDLQIELCVFPYSGVVLGVANVQLIYKRNVEKLR